jgi:hypothetical protein
MRLTYRLVHAALKREHLVDVVRYVAHVAQEFKAGLPLGAGRERVVRVVRVVWVWNRRDCGSDCSFVYGRLACSRVASVMPSTPVVVGTSGGLFRCCNRNARKLVGTSYFSSQLYEYLSRQSRPHASSSPHRHPPPTLKGRAWTGSRTWRKSS